MTKIVIVYDIVDDKTRTKLFKLLKRYGEPVQLSMFETIISDEQFTEMRTEVAKLIDGDEGSIRYYELCQSCNRRIVTLGQAKTTSLSRVYIV